MRPSPDLPAPHSRQTLASTLTAFATNLVLEISDPTVIATFRLAIAEATRSPEIAKALDSAGRDAPRAARSPNCWRALRRPGSSAQQTRRRWRCNIWVLSGMALMVGLLLGVEAPPEAAEARRRAANATAAFMQLHPDPVPAPA
jgi:hypothetical protein